MKKVGLIRLTAVLLIVMGVVYLDFEDLSFAANTKAYVALILGVIVTAIAMLYLPKSK